MLDVENYNISEGVNLEVMIYLMAVKMGIPPFVFYNMAIDEVEKLMLTMNAISEVEQNGTK